MHAHENIKHEVNEVECFFPNPNTVISYDNSGCVRSKFADSSWFLKASHISKKKKVIHFDDSLDQYTVNCIKYIIYLLIFKKDGRALSARTLINYNSVVCIFAKFVKNNNFSFFSVFSDVNFLCKFFDGISGWQKETAGSIFIALSKMDELDIGFKVIDRRNIINAKGYEPEYRASLKQHTPLPTRIYSIILNVLSKKLDEWGLVKDEVLFLVSMCYKNKLWGRTSHHNLYKKNEGISRDEIYPSFNDVCSDTLKNYLINCGYIFSVRGLWSLIGEVQLAAKLTIQAYTGMRDEEAISLPLYCELTRNLEGSDIWLIHGFTTKFNHGEPKATYWVTNFEAIRAIRIAREIAIFISDTIGVDYDENKKNIPLFLSVGHLWKLKSANNDLRIGNISLTYMKNFKSKIEPMIEVEDLKELQQIDLHRAWSAELKFRVGSQWHFSSHQLRRSLALYAHRSGIVSLPSLKRQLKHITDAMTTYYTKGSFFALDFISSLNKNHFIYEWQSTAPSSSAIGYIRNVFDYEGKLSGGHGSWVESRLKSDSVLLQDSRANIVKMFERGDISYRETLIGGCTAVGGCHQPVINWLNLDCLKTNCKNMVCTRSNLNRLILCQESLISSLDVDSIEYRIEKAALQVMIDAFNNIK